MPSTLFALYRVRLRNTLLLPAPVLLAMEEQPRLRLLAGRCFEQAGDVQEALQLVMSSSGIQRSRCDSCAHFRIRLLFTLVLCVAIRPSSFFFFMAGLWLCSMRGLLRRLRVASLKSRVTRTHVACLRRYQLVSSSG